MQWVLLAMGGVLVLAGLVLLFTRKPQSDTARNRFKLLGLEAELSGTSLVPLLVGSAMMLAAPTVSQGAPPAPRPPPATPETTAAAVITAASAARRQSWIDGPLTGNDNSAAAMKAARITGTGPFALTIDNQMGFTCTLEFDAQGDPAKLHECACPGNVWHFKNAAIFLQCAAGGGMEVCRGSTGGLADARFPNDYGFDGLAVARRLP